MKCNQCGSEWQAPKNYTVIKTCPFCGATLDEIPVETGENPAKIIQQVFNTYGVEAFRNKDSFQGIMTEFTQNPKLLMIVRNIIDSGAIDVLLDATEKAISDADRLSACHKAKMVLIDDIYMDAKKAEDCISWFSMAIMGVSIRGSMSETSMAPMTDEHQNHIEAIGAPIQSSSKRILDKFKAKASAPKTVEPEETTFHSIFDTEEAPAISIEEALKSQTNASEVMNANKNTAYSKASNEPVVTPEEVSALLEPLPDYDDSVQSYAPDNKNHEAFTSDYLAAQSYAPDNKNNSSDNKQESSAANSFSNYFNNKQQTTYNNQPSSTVPEVSKATPAYTDAVASTKSGSFEEVILKKFGLELVRCPSGSFMMGSPVNENGRWKDENLHRVTISQTFFIGKFPVTQAQYEAVMGNNPSYFEGPDNPVENVSWHEAKEYCEKLNAETEGIRQEGYEFALPTDAQWEYACRAGTKTALNNGRNLTSSEGTCPNFEEVGWYKANSNGSTHPVGQKKANNWGIYDMHGNVWEWCRDWYKEVGFDDARDPEGPSSGTAKVARGGSWDYIPRYARSAARYSCSPDDMSKISYDLFGFRVALVKKS